MSRHIPSTEETSRGGLPRPPLPGRCVPCYSLAPLIPWRTLPRPIAWDRIFGRSAPLHVEVGFGLGDFLIRRALAEGEINHVGIEIDWSLIRRTLQKLAKTGARNVALLQAGAVPALERLFPEQSIEMIWAMFPCPWPKERHVHKRLFSKSFLLLMNSRLVTEGNALVVTDDQDHARWIVAESAETGLRVIHKTAPPRFDTRYEREWKKRGQDRFHEIHFRKESHYHVPVREEIALQTRIVSSFRKEDLPSRPLKGEVGTVVPKDVLYDPSQERAMVRVLIVEEGFSQDIWLEIVRKPQAWHIRPAKGCNMIPTPGVQEALDLLQGEILARESPLSTGKNLPN